MHSGFSLPDAIRTHDLQSRSLLLYPAELRADIFSRLSFATLNHFNTPTSICKVRV